MCCGTDVLVCVLRVIVVGLVCAAARFDLNKHLPAGGVFVSGGLVLDCKATSDGGGGGVSNVLPVK